MRGTRGREEARRRGGRGVKRRGKQAAQAPAPAAKVPATQAVSPALTPAGVGTGMTRREVRGSRKENRRASQVPGSQMWAESLNPRPQLPKNQLWSPVMEEILRRLQRRGCPHHHLQEEGLDQDPEEDQQEGQGADQDHPSLHARDQPPHSLPRSTLDD